MFAGSNALGRLARMLLLPILVTIFVVVPSPTSAHWDGCATQANNVHISTGKGLVAKSSLDCGHGHDSARIDILLLKCEGGAGATPPSQAWVDENCFPIYDASHDITPVGTGKYVRQLPKPGGPELNGRGWWLNETFFTIKDNGTPHLRKRFSVVRFLDA